MNVLAVGAHPDDIELGCAGTLLRHIDKGDNVHIAITTKGGYGDRPWDTILEEVECVRRHLPVEYIVLDNPIGHLVQNWKTVSEIDDLIERYDIDTIYTTWYGDAHQDHETTYSIVLAACRKKVKNLFCFEISAYSNRSDKVFNPQLYIDISDHIDTKLEIVSCYRSYIDEFHLRAVEGLAKHRGILFKYPYAEAFEVVFMTM